MSHSFRCLPLRSLRGRITANLREVRPQHTKVPLSFVYIKKVSLQINQNVVVAGEPLLKSGNMRNLQ
ncbi:hypothetical protein RRG08_009779 [Elysia crispata]|uniref:Uncharacterized protein n=1 Tax=Elysia crispata TaxID=231223 RepID=A0AAE0ZSJ4_9GAST|nr:hypothetical protein RRG08_009779 [Elysia crispata]